MKGRRIVIYCFCTLALWLLLAQCVLFKNRISDSTISSMFKARNVPLKIHDTLIGGRNLHYAEVGYNSLPTLIFIHGSPGSWTNYRAFMWDSSLLKKYRMVSIDRPGFGYSNFGQALNLRDQVNLIAPIIKKYATEKEIYLCGHSMGAPVAVQLAADNPNLVSKLVLVGAPLDVRLEKKETWRTIMEGKPLRWALPGAFAPSNTELFYLKKDLIGLQQEFEKVSASVAFIHGDKDDWVPIENVAYGKQMLINSRAIRSDTVFGAGHLIPWKNEIAFRDLLLNLY